MHRLLFALIVLLFPLILLAEEPTDNHANGDELRLRFRPLKMLELPGCDTVHLSNMPRLPGIRESLSTASQIELYGQNVLSEDRAAFAVKITGVPLEQFRNYVKGADESWQEQPQSDGSVRFVFPEENKNYLVTVFPKESVILMNHKDLEKRVNTLFDDFLVSEIFPADVPAISGTVLLPRPYRDRHPILKNAEKLDFYLTPGKNNKDEFRVLGKVVPYSSSKDLNAKIYADTSKFFADTFANAATVGQLTPEHLESFRVDRENGKTVILLSLSQQLATDFVTILVSILQNEQIVPHERSKQ